MRQASTSTTIRILGYGGLIPFIGLAVLANIEPSHGILYRGALLLYGAVILSFVGAIHWGVAMTATNLSEQDCRSCYIWSIVPALMGWVTCILSPVVAAFLLILGFLLQYWRDATLAKKISWPAWYLPMRARLTIVVSLAMVLGVFRSFMIG